MIRSLQKRFVVTAMTAVTVLLLVLLGGINIFHAWSTARHTDSLLHFLSETEIMPPHQRPFDRRGGGIFAPSFDEDTKISNVYFTVRADTSGNVTRVDNRRIATITEEEARAYGTAALQSGKTEGRIDRFRYRVTATDGKTVCIFLDVTEQGYTILRVAALSLLVGVLCWGLMLLLIVLLSKRAIRPIAENMERQKQFVTDAGHELKTPVAIILANTDALELHTRETKWSKNIRAQTARLTRLMQDLLTLARLEEQKKPTDIAEVSLSRLLFETAEMFREPMEQRGLTVKTEIAENVTVRASREQIGRLFSILLDNAARYADENTAVQLSLAYSGRAATVKVQNRCSTLPSCAPEKLFDRFFRGDAARAGGGYGIGLSAAAAIAEQNGGSIRAEYVGEDSICFTVKL